MNSPGVDAGAERIGIVLGETATAHDWASLIDIFLHLDKHLEAVVQAYGVWVYALMFAIIFVETGLVVMPETAWTVPC